MSKSKGDIETKNGVPNSTTTYDFPYMRQPKPKRSIWRQIYNKDKNKILGRTPKNWSLLLLFYTIFYICLASFFAICIQGLLWSCPVDQPAWQLEESLIGTNPGVGFRPISKNFKQGSLIWYDAKNATDVKIWVDLLEEYLAPYRKPIGQKPVICNFDKMPGQGEVCAVDVKNFEGCSPQVGYGYNRSAPCVFLKLNKIYGWVPDFYDDIETLPEEMPETLKKHIASLPLSHRKQVWITCRPEFPADVESMGDVHYYPNQGFANYYYPYLNQDNYLSPLIAVQFIRPTLHRIINIECRAWAKNIIYSSSFRDRQGSIHFELMID